MANLMRVNLPSFLGADQYKTGFVAFVQTEVLPHFGATPEDRKKYIDKIIPLVMNIAEFYFTKTDMKEIKKQAVLDALTDMCGYTRETLDIKVEMVHDKPIKYGFQKRTIVRRIKLFAKKLLFQMYPALNAK